MPLPEIPVGTPIATALSGKEQATGLACPTCYQGGAGPKNMLYARAGQFFYYCKPGKHEFNDQLALRAMNPPKIEMAPQKDVQQPGWQTLALQLPPSVLNGLKERFGDKLAATLTQVFRTIVSGRCFIIGEEDIERAESKFGTKLTGIQMFMGELLSIHDKLTDERQRRETAEKSVGDGTRVVDGQPAKVRRGECVIWFNPEVTAKLKDKAAGRGIEYESYLEEVVDLALQNEWI